MCETNPKKSGPKLEYVHGIIIEVVDRPERSSGRFTLFIPSRNRSKKKVNQKIHPQVNRSCSWDYEI